MALFEHAEKQRKTKLIQEVEPKEFTPLSPTMKRGFQAFLKNHDIIERKLLSMPKSAQRIVENRLDDPDVKKIIEATEVQYRKLDGAKGQQVTVFMMRINEGLTLYRKKLFTGVSA